MRVHILRADHGYCHQQDWISLVIKSSVVSTNVTGRVCLASESLGEVSNITAVRKHSEGLGRWRQRVPEVARKHQRHLVEERMPYVDYCSSASVPDELDIRFRPNSRAPGRRARGTSR